MTNEQLTLAIQSGEDRYPELWEGVQRFVIKQAFTYSRYFPETVIEMDDLIQAGYLALVDAVEAFNPKAGTKLLTLLGFYLRKVWREMYGLRGRQEVLDDALSLDEPINEEGETTRLDLLPDERAELAFENAEADVFRSQLRAVLDRALDAAPHGDIMRRRYFNRERLKDIAASLGVSTSCVNQYESACRRYLRNSRFTKELRSFDFYHGTGLQAWKQTGESIQEKYILQKELIKSV